MSFSKNPTLMLNRYEPPYPKGWVETEKTREILNDIDDPIEKQKFMKVVVSHTEAGWSGTQIEDYYRNQGYKPTPKNWWDPETDTESMADSPTSPQRSGDPCQARPSHEIGGNAGKKRDNDNSYSYASGVGSDSYVSRPGFHGAGLEPPRVSWSDSPYTTEHQYQYGQSSGSHYNHPVSHQGTSYGSPSDNYPSYEAIAPSSGNPCPGHVITYPINRVNSSWIDQSGSTYVDSHSSSSHGGASGGSKQGKRSSGGARR